LGRRSRNDEKERSRTHGTVGADEREKCREQVRIEREKREKCRSRSTDGRT
jgi:hypothetical protein